MYLLITNRCFTTCTTIIIINAKCAGTMPRLLAFVRYNSVFVPMCSPNTCKCVFNPNVTYAKGLHFSAFHYCMAIVHTGSHNVFPYVLQVHVDCNQCHLLHSNDPQFLVLSAYLCNQYNHFIYCKFYFLNSPYFSNLETHQNLTSINFGTQRYILITYNT